MLGATLFRSALPFTLALLASRALAADGGWQPDAKHLQVELWPGAVPNALRLTSRGITCVLLKYRVPGSGPWWDVEHKRRVYPAVQTALQDAQRTLARSCRSTHTSWA